MHQLSKVDTHEGISYIPHHAVTAKFRVVFDAYAKTSTGVSLNDVQIIGPTIEDRLVDILIRFRCYRTVLTADVEEMFRQIRVATQHQDWQRILWRATPTEPMKVYRLTTVTYGMAASPFLTVRTLQQCGKDNYSVCPDKDLADQVRSSILNSFYVDDYLTSCDTPEEAVALGRAVQSILAVGHFPLRKWNPNDASVLQHVENVRTPAPELSIGEQDMTTVLGLRWDPAADTFHFDVTPLETAHCLPTKRKVLSEVARLYDPTGLLAPIILTGKILIQSLWAAGLGWDTPLPNELKKQWLTFRSSLVHLRDFHIPRWLGIDSGSVTTIHGFCDASAKAYAAVIYVETTGKDGQRHITLVTARTRVAPLKGSTIPRLEK